MMDNCPYCGAPGSFQEAVDGCCYVCGMVLPDSAVEPAAAEAPAEMASATMAISGPTSLPPDLPPSAAEDEIEQPAINLIQPRNLGPEYARRVTAAWQATKSPFRNPRETLNSSSITGDDPSGLLIAARSVRSVDEDRRADYELTEVIGEGNMGTVWSARQASLNREVAVKIPKHTAGGSTIGREQFISEVVVTGQLDHPNIVPIYDLARDEAGQLFYSMKRVEGQSWDQCMHEPGRTRLDNVEVLMKVCDAIRFAHDRGVIHRDIKPQNIMVGKYGEVAVMDWGIALRLDADTRMSSVAKLSPAGTPAYMAPEMATSNAGDIGPHTDVYLLGAVLYEIITREPPHPPPKDSHERIVQQNACLLIAARNLISPASETGELVDIAYKAMATDISNRYQTVDEFQDAIRSYYSHSESIALADRGHAHLANAVEMRNGVYEDYARARFAFAEALQLWPDNSRARGGLDEATIKYAEAAYGRGDYALGLSLLDRGRTDHTELLKKLTVAQRKSQRNRFMAIASAAAAACFLIGGIAVSLYFAGREYSARKDEERANQALQQANSDLDKANEDLNEKSDALLAANSTLSSQKKELEKNNLDLKSLNSQLDSTNSSLNNANSKLTSQIQLTNAAKNQAEVASYRSEVGLAAEEIQRNAFDAARDILDKQKNFDEVRTKATQPSLRNWEWGHLAYRANEPSIEEIGKREAARVEAVALSPDGQWLAWGTDDGMVRLRASADAKNEPRQLIIPADEHPPISAVTISPDSRLLFAAAGNSVWSWEIPQGDADMGPAQLLLRHTDPLKSVAVSPKGDLVLAGSADSKAYLWSRAQPAKPQKIFAGHLSGPVWQARFSPDGQQIVTAGDDESVRTWNMQTGKEIQRFEGHRGPVYAAEFSPDGKHVVSGGRDRRLLVWDLQTGNDPPLRREVIEDRLASADQSVQTNGLVQLGEHGAAIRSVSFSPPGNVLFTASEDNSVGVWDVSQGLANGRFEKALRGHGGWVRSCAAAADGLHVLSGSYDGRVYLWDRENYVFPRVLRPGTEGSLSDNQRLTSTAASPDANWIATAAENGAVTIWNMRDPLNPMPQMLTEGHAWQATTGAYFNGGSRLLTAGGDNATLVWDTRLGNEVLRIGGWKVAGGTGWRGVAAASGSGRWIATGSDDEAVLVKIWDAQSGQLSNSLALGEGDERAEREQAGNEVPEATAIAFAPGDQTLFVGDQSGNCYIFDVSSGNLRGSFVGHDGKISAAKFLPDGRLLTASSDGTVARWNLQEDRPNPQPEVLLPHRDRVVAMDISSDGRWVITAADSFDDEAVLRVWDAATNDETPEEITRLTLVELTGQHAGTDTENAENVKRPSVRSVAFHPSQSSALVTVFNPRSSTYQVADWQWDPQNLVKLISTRLPDTSMAIYSPDRAGAVLTVGGRGAQLRLANNVQMNYRPQNGVRSVSFSPDSRVLACAGNDGSIKVWRFDAEASKWLPDQRLFDGQPEAINSVAFHPLDNNVLLSAGDDGRARIWNRGPDGWSVTKTLGAENDVHGPIHQAIFSPPDGNQAVDIITAGADTDQGRVKIWNFAGELVREHSYNGPVQCVAVSRDRKWIVSGVGSEAWVWNRELPQDAPELMLPGHSAEITSLTFSPDGSRLFTASRDFNIKLWDTKSWDSTDANRQSQRELLNLEGHTDAVTSVSYFDNPTYPSLLTAGADGQAILWPTVKWQE